MSLWTWLFGPKSDPIPPAPADALGAATLPKAVPVIAVGDPSTPRLTVGFMRQAFPRCADPAAWADAFNLAFARVGGFNRDGAACILAKANTEAGGLTRWDEDLFYTSVEQVVKMHGKRAGSDPASLLRNPKKMGDQVYAALGGYDGRGLGAIQLTGLVNQTLFAEWMGMTLAEARRYMLTIPGAAMTAPWYVWHFGARDAANRGDMKAVLACVAGKSVAGLVPIWTAIHGDKQMADFARFRGMLA